MKISLNWLKTLVDCKENAETIESVLTASGLEVEHYEEIDSVKGGMRGLLVGEVKECIKHPNADKLSLTKVDTGNGELLSIVCGAPNVKAGIKVIVAPVGTTVYPVSGEPFSIQKAKIRGENSEGMLCAEDEIGLGQSHDGLLILPDSSVLGSKVSEMFKIESDVVFDIGLTANRGDAASHLGVARELSTLLQIPFRMYHTSIQEVSIKPSIEIKVEDNEACPRFCGIELRNIQVAESPVWLKNRLLSIGLRPINNVVDISNFVMHELGQPLHAYDLNSIKGKTIHVRRAKENEVFTTLDSVERKLKGIELMVCDNESPMCLAGVFGGLNSGVTGETVSIFLESAFFAPDVVRKGAKLHALNTDSSFRFERGTDPEMCIPALKKAVSLLIEHAQAEIASEIIDLYPTPLLPFRVELKKSQIKKITGIEIPEARIEQILKGLGITILNSNSESFSLEIPRIKSDVTREIDVIEELIRIYGFEHIPLQKHLSMALNYNASNSLLSAENTIRNVLSANGFSEIINNSLNSDIHYENKTDLVYLSNPLSKEMNVMRASMLYPALESIAYNKNRKQSDIHFFEFGKVYNNREKGFKEIDQLLIIASGNKTNESWEEKPMEVDAYFIKSIAKKVCDQFAFNGGSIAIEEVDAKVLQNFGIKDRVFYTVLEWTKLAKQKKNFTLEPIPQFPVVRRDLSLVVNKQIRYEQIEEIIRKKGGKKVKGSNVFDVYEGKPLDEQQKSISISIELYDNEKTMSDADIDPIIHSLIGSFETELNAIIRK